MDCGYATERDSNQQRNHFISGLNKPGRIVAVVGKL